MKLFILFDLNINPSLPSSKNSEGPLSQSEVKIIFLHAAAS